MNKKLMSLIIILFFLCTAYTVDAEEELGETAELIPLNGIALKMKKNKLVNNWGFPAKRDHKINADVWYYANENTANPTDGIVVHFKKGRISGWKVVNNIYSEMDVWSKGAGSYR